MVSGRTAERHVGRVWAGEASGVEAIVHLYGGKMRMPHTGGEGHHVEAFRQRLGELGDAVTDSQ
jgi:hypothetical protein